MLDDVRIVLVSPLYGGNIGSVCRAMANMGLSDLAIAAPRRNDMNEARMMACHARDILESRTEYPDLAAAVADCGMVVGTTARLGLYRQHVKTPRELAKDILASSESRKAAIVFGREDNGLSNEELALCTQLIRIPVTAEYESINMAQAVLICCYELFLAADIYEAPVEKSDLASSELRERMFALWKETLFEIGFMKDDKAEHMMLGLRRLLSRGQLTVDDVKIMMGIARQSLWAATRHDAKQDGFDGENI